jgi:hypothetical protein
MLIEGTDEGETDGLLVGTILGDEEGTLLG